MTSETKWTPGEIALLRKAADCITFNVGGDDIDVAEALAARGELRRWAGKRDRTFTYAITKKGRALLCAEECA